MLLEGICIDANLEAINQHDGILELAINIMTSSECEYIKPDRIWANESILFWVTHFLFSLTKENSSLCDKLGKVAEIKDYLEQGIGKLDATNINIISNLSGLSYNLCQSEFKEKLGNSGVFTQLVQQPIMKILVDMRSPQVEFKESFAENLAHARDAISSNNEDEEAISNEPKPSGAKLAQMMSDFLTEMGTEIKKWKNYSIGNITALEVISQLLSDGGKCLYFNNRLSKSQRRNEAGR